MLIHLVRHASTEWNEKRLWQGRKDLPLSDRGREEARSLAFRFVSRPIDRIYSSPLKRALETAKEISLPHNLEIEVLEDLKEADFSRWEGRPGDEVKREEAEIYEMWATDPNIQIDGIEPVSRVHDRALRSLNYILENGGDEVVVVTHAMVLRAMVCHVLKAPIESFREFLLANASVTTVTFNDSWLRLISLNDTSHLRGWGL